MAVCTHLDRIAVLRLPDAIAGCEECLRIGSTEWSWCYVDEVAFLVQPSADAFAGDAKA